MPQLELVAHLKQRLLRVIETIFTEERKKSVLKAFVAKIDFDRVLLSAALRKAYGAPPKHIDLYADKSPEAIWAWELGTPAVYLDP